MHLSFPKLHTVAYSDPMLSLCHKARETEDEEILFDLSKTEFTTPFGITILSGTISECLKRGKRCKYIEPKDRSARKFLTKIGFAKHFHLEEEVTKIYHTSVQLKKLSSIDPIYVDQIIQVFSRNIRMTDGVRDSLKMSLIETMINAFDHSGQDFCYICAQAYPQAESIRVCITDFGQGILSSLSKAPQYRSLRNSNEAIKKSLEEGVSSRQNTTAGYGLTHIARFIEINRGRMVIISGDGKVSYDYDRKEYKDQLMRLYFQGTIINIKINADEEGFYFLAGEGAEEMF